jgi:predicted  nucleic acid-binding Zn-ribbon protein
MPLNLEALYRCERESEDLARELGELPVGIEKALAGAQAARDAVKAQRDRLELAEQTRRQKEGDLADTEAQRDRYKGQTALVKTNTEYTALLSEIETAGQRIAVIEEEILTAMELIEEVSSSFEAFDRDRRREEEGFVREADVLKTRLAEVEERIQARDRERDALIADMPPNVRAGYDRTHKARGSGTAAIVERGCSACHLDIPYETINRVQAAEIHTCSNCQRILVVLDE